MGQNPANQPRPALPDINGHVLRTLFDPAVRSDLTARVETLRPDSVRRWGRMSPHQAICHLSDGFRMVLGQKTAAPAKRPLSPALRWVALSLPFRWPRGVATMPEVEQGSGGTPPVDFDGDRDELLVLMNRFCARSGAATWPDHPMLGPMSERDWGRWAYRHLDHHLRQFGA